MVYGFYLAIVDACADKREEEGWDEGKLTLSALNDALLNLLCSGWRVLGIKQEEAIKMMEKTWKFQEQEDSEDGIQNATRSDGSVQDEEETRLALEDLLNTLLEDKIKN